MTKGDIMSRAAVSATVLAFSVKTMTALRIAARFTNLCFIGYGTTGGMLLVMVPHLALQSCHVARLAQDLHRSAETRFVQP